MATRAGCNEIEMNADKRKLCKNGFQMLGKYLEREKRKENSQKPREEKAQVKTGIKTKEIVNLSVRRCREKKD